MLPISPRLPLVLAIIVAVGMIAATAWQAYEFWQSETASSGNVGGAAARDSQQPEKQTPDIRLGSLSMFGQKNETEAAPEENLDDLPETNLRLVLRGVMSASGDFPGSALVEDSKRQTEAYIVGDELPGNATLRAVRADRIIIERSGSLENLYFPEDEDRSGIVLAAERSDSGGSDPAPDYNQQNNVNQTGDARREEIRQRLEQLRNRLRNNN